MGWADKVRDTWRWAMNTEIGQQLAQRAKQKADEGMDRLLSGQPQEGERLIEEAKVDAAEAVEAERNREGPPAQPPPS